ncbi:MAG: hypothetical protein QNJ55_00640 [Xenococcus sp. MO_188.B8]|nr:hypothetical protein [Xenococcus sp. MO_188.B8]
MTNSTNICTWFYSDSIEEESLYPQVGGKSSSKEFQEIYLRCVIVFFSSSLRQNPNANHILFTNLELFPDIGNFKAQDFLNKNGIKLITLPLTYKTPKYFYGSWRNQFYLFDILKYLSKIDENNQKYIILDSDCVWVNSAKRISDDLDKYGILGYRMDRRSTNDLSGKDLKEIYKELSNHEMKQIPYYFGGEWIAACGNFIKIISKEVDPVWNNCLKRFNENKPKLLEEAYVLSYIYHKLGFEEATANSYIRRIWGLNYSPSGEPSEIVTAEQALELTIWHLPGQKKYGFKRLFGQVIKPNSKFWSLDLENEFKHYLGCFMGIPKSSLIQKIYNKKQKYQEKILRKLNKNYTLGKIN